MPPLLSVSELAASLSYRDNAVGRDYVAVSRKHAQFCVDSRDRRHIRSHRLRSVTRALTGDHQCMASYRDGRCGHVGSSVRIDLAYGFPKHCSLCCCIGESRRPASSPNARCRSHSMKSEYYVATKFGIVAESSHSLTTPPHILARHISIH